MKPFKCMIIFIFCFFLVMNFFYSGEKTGEWPVLKGPYLGQEPPGLTPELFAPGIISTGTKNELNAVFSQKGDEFYFAIYTPEPVNTCVIMVSRQVKGIWTVPEKVSFSGNAIDVDMALSPDGNKLYFCSTRSNQPGSALQQKHDIWFATRLKDKKWSEPLNLGFPVNTAEAETYPCFTRNGRMYFSSSRQGGKGDKDLYYSQQINGIFSDPVNLGNAINTQYGEGDTFVAPDESYLIVSARGRPDSIGGGDLYISFKKEDGSWTTAKNMGKPINTSASEYCPMVSPDGKYLFFSRYADGKSDIFWVDSKITDTYRP